MKFSEFDEIDNDQAANSSNDFERLPAIPGHQIVRRIQSGGMGSVYEGIEQASGLRVAVKTISTTLFHKVSEQERARFEREIEVLSKIEDPKVVRILRYGVFNTGIEQLPFYTMKYFGQGDLRKELAKSPIQSRERLVALIQKLIPVIRSLERLHQQGIIHRDLKPENLFIDDDGQILIGDFGLVKSIELDRSLTKSIGQLGTTLYSAPEQMLDAKRAAPTNDIFSLGVVIYQLLCGNLRPYESAEGSVASSENELIAARHRDPDLLPTAPSKRPFNVSDRQLDRICLKCLEFYPQHRYPTAGELADDFERWLSGAPIRYRSSEWLRLNVLRPARRHWLLSMVAVSFVVAAIAIGGWLTYRSVNMQLSIAESDRIARQRLIDNERKGDLEKLVPLLHGGELSYTIDGSVTPQTTNSENHREAQRLVELLNLEDSDDFSERHLYWCVRFANRRTKTVALSPAWIEEIGQIATQNLALANRDDPTELDLAASDLLRTRLVAAEFWRRRGLESESKSDSLLADAKFKEIVEELEAMQLSSSLSPPTQRWLERLILLLKVRERGLSTFPTESSQPTRALIESSLERFALDRLNQSDLLQTWYCGWYIFQDYFFLEWSEANFEKCIEIGQRWLDFTERTPYPEKSRNLTALTDAYFVRQCIANAYFYNEDYENALAICEAIWADIQEVERWKPSLAKVWAEGEAVAKLMTGIASEQQNPSGQLAGWRRRCISLRNLVTAYSNEKFDLEDAVNERREAQLRLAQSLTELSAIEESRQLQISLLQEADERLDDLPTSGTWADRSEQCRRQVYEQWRGLLVGGGKDKTLSSRLDRWLREHPAE